MSIVDELEKLNEMHRNGTLSDEEFRKAKESLIDRHQSTESNSTVAVTSEESVWGLLIHVTQYAGHLVPFGGWLVPLTLWLVKKNESRFIDQQGRIVMNWLLSQIIYGIIFGLLCMIVIGIPFVIILGVLSFVFPIIGAVKASGGEVWSYPCSLRFLSVDEQTD